VELVHANAHEDGAIERCDIENTIVQVVRKVDATESKESGIEEKRLPLAEGAKRNETKPHTNFT